MNTVLLLNIISRVIISNLFIKLNNFGLKDKKEAENGLKVL